MIFDYFYNKGYEAGKNAQRCENAEAQNRRLEDMLKYGKAIGKAEGWEEGYRKGYECGYTEGEMDARTEVGAIDLEGLEALKA